MSLFIIFSVSPIDRDALIDSLLILICCCVNLMPQTTRNDIKIKDIKSRHIVI